MRIRKPIWATSALILSASLCLFQVSKRQAQAQGEPDPSAPDPAAIKLYNTLSQSEKDARLKKGFAFHAAIENSLNTNYKPKASNGTQRAGLTLDQLPADLQKEAGEQAQQYTQGIYPILRRYANTQEGKLAESWRSAPELRPYMKDREYKGTGPYLWGRGGWGIGTGWRMDGTLIGRALSDDASSAPVHDVWAQYGQFMDVPQLGQGFLIHGWDDGKVTFDPVKTMYRADVQTAIGLHSVIAPPGQAGIPPEIKTHIVAPEIYQFKPATEAKPDATTPKDATTKTNAPKQ